MAAQIDPPRSIAPISSSDPNSIVTSDWLLWFYQILQNLQGATRTLGSPLQLTGQNTAIGLSTLTLPTLANGNCRVNWYIRIEVPDGVASSVALTIGFTDTAIALSKTFPAITGDTIATFGEGSMFVPIDQNTAITYQTSYGSVTPNKMHYRLVIDVESV